ncbi:hypothetical protein, partial [Vibrio campbellii]|uniref:hypothetical protein n=1 Tax=Vibrio campbellii TaxID=680 RepID=UPI001BD9F41E
MKPTLVGRDTLHELDQPLKKLAYVSNHWGPLLYNCFNSLFHHFDSHIDIFILFPIPKIINTNKPFYFH